MASSSRTRHALQKLLRFSDFDFSKITKLIHFSFKKYADVENRRGIFNTPNVDGIL